MTDFLPDLINFSVRGVRIKARKRRSFQLEMSRFHPAAAKDGSDKGPGAIWPCPSNFTVWKRSSMTFQGTDGFTVFDEHGKLAFRVENYSRRRPRGSQGGLVLMDGLGRAIITMQPQVTKGKKKQSFSKRAHARPMVETAIVMLPCRMKQIPSMRRQWNAYVGEGDQLTRIFSMKRSSRVRGNVTEEVELSMAVGSKGVTVEGSFRGRNCIVRDSTTGEELARITRKRAKATVLLDNDVFSLVVQLGGIGSEIVMAFVVIMDRICCNALPALCY
ncbi:hypothetical protein MLD38_029830 [Melastoma candidum]|uniref:Uncharacterized protein n=1 Tax=Melastoma candidum TaxID=119954 RepID=A0ACB9N6X4_9MYRT|nr:hypothetical protein MLD38_029830 [Melastoma candidum]